MMTWDNDLDRVRAMFAAVLLKNRQLPEVGHLDRVHIYEAMKPVLAKLAKEFNKREGSPHAHDVDRDGYTRFVIADQLARMVNTVVAGEVAKLVLRLQVTGKPTAGDAVKEQAFNHVRALNIQEADREWVARALATVMNVGVQALFAERVRDTYQEIKTHMKGLN